MKKRLSLLISLLLVLVALFSFNFKLNVNASETSDTEKIQEEIENIYVPSETIFSFPLVTNSVYGSTIEWTSSNPSVISIEDGWAVVTRPSDEDVTVQLTVTITRGGISDTETFSVLVKKGTTLTNIYNITYELNGGTNNVNNPNTYQVGNTYELQDPTKGSVEFLGWYLNGKRVDKLPLGLSGDITLVAHWANAVVESISVTKAPDKTTYNALESFDASGIIVNANYNDNTSVVVDVNDLSFNKTILHANDESVVVSYQGKTCAIDITVNKINLDLSEVQFEDKTVTYNGLAQSISISGTLPAGVSVSYSDGLTNAGEKEITASFSLSEELAVDYNPVADMKATLTVSKAPLKAIIGSLQIKPGDAIPSDFGVTFQGFVNGESESVLGGAIVYSTDATPESEPDTYDVYASGLSSDNYEIEYVKGSLTISESEYEIRVDESSLTKTYNGQKQMFTVTLYKDGNVSSEALNITCDGQAFDGALNAGDYVVTISFGELSVTKTFVILKANYDAFVFEDATKEYNGSVQSIAIEGTLPEGLSVSYSEGLKDVGSKTITATFTNTNENYNTPDAIDATLTITAKALDVNMFDAISQYPETGSEIRPVPSAKFNGVSLVKDVDFEVVSYSNNVSVGQASVTVKGIGNFSSEVTLTFTITVSDLDKVREARLELVEDYATELPAEFVTTTSNGSKVFYISTSTALSIDSEGKVSTILTNTSVEVVVYAMITYNDAAEYAMFTYTLAAYDVTSGIEVDGLDSNIILSVTQDEEEALGNYNVQANEQVIAGYDISLSDGTETVQPDTSVTVRILIPQGYENNDTLRVYHVNGNELENVQAEIEEGYLVFEATSFSPYIVVIEKEEVLEPEIETKTISELLNMETGSTYYQVTGVIRNINSTIYGNFDLCDVNDESVKIYVYGLTKEQVSSNDKSFASLGLKEGDVVTLCSPLGEYNGTLQLGGKETPAYYVSHVSPEYNVTVEAEGEGTVSPASATLVNGSEFTFTATPNEGYEVKSITVNGTAQSTLSYTIVISSNTSIKVEFSEVSQGGGEGGDEPSTEANVVFVFGENGDASHNDGTDIGAAKDYVSGTYTLSISGASKVYDGARDAKGTSALKLGTGKVAGSFTFTVPANVSSVIFKIAGYKANTAKIDINGTAYTVEKFSDNGEFNEYTVDTTSTKTITFATVSGGYRAMIYSITYVIGSGSGSETPEPELTAEQKVKADMESITLPTSTIANLTLATSGANGSSISWASDNEAITNSGIVTRGTEDVEVKLTATFTLDGHTETKEYTVVVTKLDSFITGEPKTYTFSDYPAGTQYAAEEVHVLDDNTTVTTTEAHFTGELRLYSSSTHNGFAIIKSKTVITGFGFNAGNKDDILNVYGSTDGETWTLIQAVSVTSAYADYSLTVGFEGNNYTYLKLDVEGTQQVRLKSFTLTCQSSAN